jgi:hypothetical protein
MRSYMIVLLTKYQLHGQVKNEMGRAYGSYEGQDMHTEFCWGDVMEIGNF